MNAGTAAERVRLGAMYLDAHWPGWQQFVDVNVLCMTDTQKCVVGQMFGDYWHGLVEMDISETEAVFIGLDINDLGELGDGHLPVDPPSLMDQLQHEWELVLTK